MSHRSLRHRFPGVRDGWARFDGPAGTQMVDVAIQAMAEWAASGNNANSHGAFPASAASDGLMERARATVGQLLNADPAGICFGANMTTMTMAFTRAIGVGLGPGDRIVGTRLDHEANVSSWRIACERSGAEHVLCGFDPATGQLDMAEMARLITPNTRWVAVTGASNLIGTKPDLAAVVALAHAAGARVFVDAVHLAPHSPIDITALGVDALVTSPYKWYGPHAGVLWCEPALLDSLPVAKVRPADDEGPRRFETGTPNYEGIAAVEAAARFLIEEGMDQVAAGEADVFRPLLEGLQAIPGVRVWGPPTMADRAPTAAFTIDGMHSDDVAAALAAEKIAVWSGHSYALEVVDQLGLAPTGGVVRAGVVRYIDPEDVDRLLDVVRRLATR